MAAVKSAGSTAVSVSLVEILGEEDAYAYADALQKLNSLATHADTTRVAFRMRIINQLRSEGLDGKVGGARGFFGEGSDAVRTAEKAVQPLAAIVHDLENVGRNAHVFRARTQSMVFDPIRQARESRDRGTAGLVVR
jgi:hypothetical protein